MAENETLLETEKKEAEIAPVVETMPEVPEVPDQETEAERVADRVKAEVESAIGTIDYWEKRAKELEKEIAATQTKKKKLFERLVAPSEKTVEEKLEEEMKEAGIPKISEDVKAQRLKVAKLQGEMDKLEMRYLGKLEKLAERPGGESWASAEEARITREYKREKAYMAAELSAQAAVLQALQNNLVDARNLVEDAIKAFSYDQEQNRRRLEYILEYHQDYLNELGKEYRTVFSNALEEARRKEEETKENLRLVGNLMLENPRAGIKITDTPEEAIEKAKSYLAAQPEKIERPFVREIEGKLYQWNEATGTWEKAPGVSPFSEADFKEDVVNSVTQSLARRGLSELDVEGLSRIEKIEIFNDAFQTMRFYYSPNEISDKEIANALNQYLRLSSAKTRKDEGASTKSTQEIATGWILDFSGAGTTAETTSPVE